MNRLLLIIDLDFLQTSCDAVIVGIFILQSYRVDGAILRLLLMLPVVVCLASWVITFMRRFLYQRSFQLLPDENILFRVQASFLKADGHRLRVFPGFLSATDFRLVFEYRNQRRVSTHESITSVDYRSRFLGIERWVSIVSAGGTLTFGVNFPKAFTTELNRALERSRRLGNYRQLRE